MSYNLGRLERVELRDIWSDEAQDFAPWLAEQETLVLLGDTIGLELELEAKEKPVGHFRADILCKDTTTDSWVLIENQLGRTDHTHMGQLLTYAAGLHAVTIVWIAARFTDEHRATLDWLNDTTDEKVNFFGLEVKQELANIVQRFERLCSQQLEATRQAEQLFLSLLHQAFSGGLFPSDIA